jgi:regulator of cell morphogenesis and NO signaling
MKEPHEHATVGDIIAADFRAVAVFEQFGIDFRGAGSRPLADACRAAAADPDAVIHALDALPPRAAADDESTNRPVDRLIDHILATHHAYVRSAVPTIARYLETLQSVDGARHPELTRVAAIFGAVSANLERHMFKEEQILFPYVRELAATTARDRGVWMSPFGTVENPIRMLEREHLEAAGELRVIRELTNGYTTPDDGCPTYEVCLAELARFERDLQRHVNLENSVLFPKAVELEQQLVGS